MASWQEAPPVRLPVAEQMPPAQAPLPPAERTPAPPFPRKKSPDRSAVKKPAAKADDGPPPDRATEGPSGPLEVPPSAWQSWENAPPVRRGIEGFAPAVPVEEPAVDGASAEATDTDYIAPRRRKMPLVLTTIFLLLVAGASVAGWVFLGGAHRTEDELYEQALKEYQGGRYQEAGRRFEELQTKNPESARWDRYQFLADWSLLRDQANQLTTPPAEAYQGVRVFVRAHRGDPLLKEYGADVGETYAKLTEDLIEAAKLAVDPKLLQLADAALKDAERYPSPATAKLGALRARLDEIRVAVEREQRQRRFLDFLAHLATKPSRRTWDELDQALAEYPEFRDDAKTREFLVAIRDAMRRFISWNPGDTEAKAPPDEADPSLLIVPAIVKAGKGPAGGSRVVFAVARGVLYALEGNNGGVRWATRVGIDTTALPVLVPAAENAPEIALVLSSDTNTLTARDVQSGQRFWGHRLSAPCLGRPTVLDGRVYVPTYDGRVHEIEIVAGKYLGYFDLGQPLGVGGVHRPGTRLLYFPAEKGNLYVLDLAKRDQPCAAILDTGHPAGSLRSEPIVISREEQRRNFNLGADAWPDYLLLSQADGLNLTRLRVYTLAGDGATATPRAEREPQVPGWTWFPPQLNGERFVQVTDAGILGLIGINQVRNQDQDLFLEHRHELFADPGRVAAGRAQVAHLADDDVWVIAGGELQLLHYYRLGSKLAPRWPASLPLGSPLHASQHDDNSHTLFLVTQALAQPTCWATAVDSSGGVSDGQVRWKNQLGMVCQGEPVAVGGRLLTLDQGGGLFRFDPTLHPHQAEFEWQTGGQLLAGPPEDALPEAALVPGRDGQSAFAVSALGKRGLLVRRYADGKVTEHRFDKLAPPAGTFGVGDNALVLPLADGKLLHAPIDGTPSEGPEWRARHAAKDAPGHVVHLGGDEFLATDGSRGLSRWSWSGGTKWTLLTTGELPERIAAPPVVLPRAKPDDPLLIVAADARGNLYLLREGGSEKKPRTWSIARSWPLGVTLTAGPFLRGQTVGCVVDHERLLWIDPSKDAPLWEYRRRGEGIVGDPRLEGKHLIVAHQTGVYLALDPATGTPAGPSYVLKSFAAPAATPVPFGEGRVFAPLTDGTVLLLSVQQLLAEKE